MEFEEPDDIPAGELENHIGYEKANKIRDKTPGLTPRCSWGVKVDRCQEEATVRHRTAERFDWRYACDRHAFDPGWGDVCGRVQCGSEWEWIGDVDREPPEYPIPQSLKDRKNEDLTEEHRLKIKREKSNGLKVLDLRCPNLMGSGGELAVRKPTYCPYCGEELSEEVRDVPF